MQAFNLLTNGIRKAFSGMGNNPNSTAKAQGNSGDTNTKRVSSATKSDATAAKSSGKFKRFVGQ